MDTAPAEKYLGEAAIQPENDAYVVIERGGFMSQYCIAASLKHPLMFLAVHEAFVRLLNAENVLTQYVPFTTGLGALKGAGIRFMQDPNFAYPKAGLHAGMSN